MIRIRPCYRRALFLFALVFLPLSSCATGVALSPIGDATTHGVVIFDGRITEDSHVWKRYDPVRREFAADDMGGGFYRIDNDVTNAELGPLATLKQDLKNADFLVMHMQAGSYALSHEVHTSFGGMVHLEHVSYPSTDYTAYYMDAGTPMIVVRPGDVVFVGSIFTTTFGDTERGNRATVRQSAARFDEVKRMVGGVVDPTRMRLAAIEMVMFTPPE